MLQMGVHIDLRNDQWQTALHCAARGEDFTLVRYLLVEAKAASLMADLEGLLPLDIAMRKGNAAMVGYLLKVRAARHSYRS